MDLNLSQHLIRPMFFSIGGITIQVKSDLPITNVTFHSKIQKFQVGHPGEPDILLSHHFSLPPLDWETMGRQVYHDLPWTIYRKGNSWIYVGISSEDEKDDPYQIILFNNEHTIADIYNQSPNFYLENKLEALTLFGTDQILLARVLPDKQGCIFHSAGMIIDGNGFLFVGHSGAGKSTIVDLLRTEGEILCDDRNIVRRFPEEWRIFGTWSHGDIPDVSPSSAPLRAIFLLEQAPENRIIPIEDTREIVRKLPFYIVKAFVTADWWDKTLTLVGRLAREVPIYRLRFKKSQSVIEVLKPLMRS